VGKEATSKDKSVGKSKRKKEIQLKAENLCVKCGKKRIFKRTYQEYIGLNLVTFTDMICPDPACQKAVDKISRDRKERTDFLKRKRVSIKVSKKSGPKSKVAIKA
jgi:hypothetical protein